MKKLFCILLVSLIPMGIADFGFAQKSVSEKNQEKEIDQSLRKGETRSTLDPNLFKDPIVKQAYRIAKEIPWVLDSIYCFCYCEESKVFKHKSLLSCYVDNHAAR